MLYRESFLSKNNIQRNALIHSVEKLFPRFNKSLFYQCTGIGALALFYKHFPHMGIGTTFPHVGT